MLWVCAFALHMSIRNFAHGAAQIKGIWMVLMRKHLQQLQLKRYWTTPKFCMRCAWMAPRLSCLVYFWTIKNSYAFYLGTTNGSLPHINHHVLILCRLYVSSLLVSHHSCAAQFLKKSSFGGGNIVNSHLCVFHCEKIIHKVQKNNNKYSYVQIIRCFDFSRYITIMPS